MKYNYVEELMTSHFGNKLFEINPALCKTIHYEDKEFNQSLKTKTGFNKNLLVPIILALTLTIVLFTTLVLAQGINYIGVLIFITVICLNENSTRLKKRMRRRRTWQRPMPVPERIRCGE